MVGRPRTLQALKWTLASVLFIVLNALVALFLHLGSQPVRPKNNVIASLSCSVAVDDCAAPTTSSSDACADYAGEFASPWHNAGMLGSAAPVAVAMAFCIGGNDAANAWATTVGSGALSLRNAVILGGFGEWLGATLLGQGVSDTIRKGVSDMDDSSCWACGKCHSLMPVYAVGMLAALIGAATFLFAATFGSMPVSTTHAIVGGVVGMTIAGTSGSCLNWSFKGLGGIVASWVISPLLSGVIAAATFAATEKLIVRTRSPVRRALLGLPCIFALTTWVMVALTLVKSKPTKHLGTGVHIGASTAVSALMYFAVHVWMVPSVSRALSREFPDAIRSVNVVNVFGGAEMSKGGGGGSGDHASVTTSTTTATIDEDAMHIETDSSAAVTPPPSPPSESASQDKKKQPALASQDGAAGREERPTAELAAIFLFRYPLVFVAFTEAFAHGANDTANATSAFAAIWMAYNDGLYACSLTPSPWWIMSVSGAFVGLGVIVMGARVIQTIGSDLSKNSIDYQLGFAVELASVVTVVLATAIGGLPVSTTHCKVGAVVVVGLSTSGRQGVNLGLLGKIVTAWVMTLPLAGGVAALLTLVFRSVMHADPLNMLN